MSAQIVDAAVRASSAWDSRYDLPTHPKFNNPWIYMAYLDAVMRLAGSTGLDRGRVVLHFMDCEKAATGDYKGIFARWPDGSGGNTSHDEIMGAAYLSSDIARWVLRYLDGHGGNFNSTGRKDPNPLRFNVYRFPWLRPYLGACAVKPGELEFAPGIIGQALWSIHCLLGAWKDVGPSRAGSRLRTWLMLGKMNRYPLCRAAGLVWLIRMKKESLQGSLFLEPGSDAYGQPAHRIASQLAPVAWALPSDGL